MVDLRVDGLVEAPRSFTPDELDALPTVEARVPGRKDRPDTVGDAFRLGDVLAQVDVNPAATHATCRSVDGEYTASIPLDDLRSQGLVMRTPDGPSPWRLVVADGRTLCWNVKGLVSVELTAGKVDDSVPANPPH